MKKSFGYLIIKKRQGFTLIEMLIVIVIIGILSASLIPRVIGIQSRARDIQRQSDMRTLSTALKLYYRDNQTFPLSSCNAPSEYITNTNPFICNWQVSGATTGTVSYSLFSGFLTELEGQYVSSIPLDPQNTIQHGYRYSYLNRNSADNIYMKDKCSIAGSSSDFTDIISITYQPEVKRKNDIVSSCPNNTPRDVAYTGDTNRYTYRREMTIYDDKYAPTGEKKIPGECWEPKKNAKCL